MPDAKPFNSRLMILPVLAVSQAVCLAVGIWIQYRVILVLAESAETEAIATAAPARIDAESSSDATGVSADALRRAMTTSMPFAFLWIAGLQAVAAYLVLTRLQSEHDQIQTRSKDASLVKAKELVRTRDAIIFGLAKLAESRDQDTGCHLDRIALYSTRLAQELRKHPRYRDRVSLAFVRSIGVGSALHDIGKVGVADSILLKPGKLSNAERKEMQLHATIGGDCIRQIEQRLGNSTFLAMAREIAYCHHERWDGTGYPANLMGEEIPLAARIVAIADVYDALSSERAYKPCFSHEKCVAIIRREAGAHFDPHLADVFLSIAAQFESIARRHHGERKFDTDSSRTEEFNFLKPSDDARTESDFGGTETELVGAAGAEAH